MAVSPSPRPALARVERYLLAHVVAYPIAFLWAMGMIPLTIHLHAREIDALNDDLPAIGQFVVHRLAWPAGAAFVLPHLFAIPWAFGREPARWRRPAWIGIGGVAAAGILLGGASWLWLVLR